MKRYLVAERGAHMVRDYCAREAHGVAVSALFRVEAMAAVAQRGRAGSLDEETQRDLLLTIGDHVDNQYAPVPVGERVLRTAARVAQRWPLRSLDAIQIASALAAAERLPQLQFWTADRRQAAAAEGEGLAVMLVG